MKNEATYIFDNEKVYTVVDGKVVASVKESEWGQDPAEGGVPQGEEDWTRLVKDLAAEGHSPEEIAGQLGMDGTGMAWSVDDIRRVLGEDQGFHQDTRMPGPPKEIQDDLMEQNQPPHTGSRVTTPNGLSGQVLGRVSGMWGDEVTVRFDNGRIVRVPVNQDLTFEAASHEEPESPVIGLNTRLAAEYDGTQDSLKKRVEELESIKLEAAKLIRETKDFDTEQELDQIRVQADYELGEVHAALEHLSDEAVQAFEAPAPFDTQVVEQEHVGNGDSNWLDHTLGEMISEAESTDYEKLMDEGPEALVAGMDDAAIADAGVTREVASRFIKSKTAAASSDIREKYEGVWLSRVEECRKAELLNRKEATKKEAAVEEDQQGDLPDDILFT